MFAPLVSATGTRPAQRAVPARPAPCLQRKLAVGRVDDPLEHEADRVADEVVGMPTSETTTTPSPARVSRKCAECDEGEMLQPKRGRPVDAGGGVPASVHQVLGSPGRPLDAATRAYFEPRFGRDFSRVQVHTGPLATRSARDVEALAYTVGRDIVFDAAQFAPATHEGRRLIAHELAHVMQQTGASGSPDSSLGPSGDRMLARQPARPPMRQPTRGPVRNRRAPTRGPMVVPEENPREIVFNKPPANQNAPVVPVETVPGRPQAVPPVPVIPPSPYRDEGRDTDWAAAAAWNGRQRDVARLRRQLESEPRAVLDRGGAAPDFLARGPRETYRLSASDELLYDNLKQGMGIDYDPTLFHMLDAIEHDFMLATTPDEDLGLFLSYLPELAPKRSMLDLSGPRLPATYTLGGKTYRPTLPVRAAIVRVDVWFDPKTAQDRLDAIKAVMSKRAKLQEEAARLKQEQEREQAQAAALAEAENVALTGRKRKEGKCTRKRNSQKGGNKRHNSYAIHVAKEKGYGKVTDELTWTTPEGVALSFDTYDPNDLTKVWEVKTRHEWTSPTGMATAPYRVPDFSRRVEDLEVQRLTGLYIANRCGLEFRYAVDNCDAFTGLRQQWALPPVEYIPYPGEQKQPC